MGAWRLYRVASTGGEVVKKELQALEPNARAAVLQTMQMAQEGRLLPRQDETVKGSRLRALRVTHDGSEYRVLYARLKRHDVLLALLVLNKKSSKLPTKAIRKAEGRLKDWLTGPNS